MLLLALLSMRPALERRLVAMGTSLGVTVTGADRAAALDASEAAVREIERVEALLSTWREGTALSRVNAAPVGRAVPVPDELLEVLQAVLSLRERTGGAFDPTVAPLVAAWDLRGVGRVPDAARLALAREALGTVSLDPSNGTVTRRHPLSGFEEGAWGKGYALDRAATVLRDRGLGGVLDLGGQLLSVGETRADVAHPRDRGRAVVSLRLRDASLSTSGNSERRHGAIGHLLDPRTGRPASDFGSVTVLAPTGLVADVLSTALFVLGPGEGLRVSNVLRASGLAHEALFLIGHGPRLEARATPGLLPHLVTVDGSVSGLPRINSEGGHIP